MRHDIGILMILLGFFLVVISVFQTAMKGSSGHSDLVFGGVIMIGPIPIVFGSSPQMAILSMLIAMALIIISFLLFRRGT